MGEEDPELVAHEALADVVVAVAVRAERFLRVVDVQGLEAVEADLVVHVFYDAVQLPSVSYVVAGRVEMARVEADAEVRVTVEPVDDGRELVDGASDRTARSGGVLEQQPRLVRGV